MARRTRADLRGPVCCAHTLAALLGGAGIRRLAQCRCSVIDGHLVVVRSALGRRDRGAELWACVCLQMRVFQEREWAMRNTHTHTHTHTRWIPIYYVVLGLAFDLQRYVGEEVKVRGPETGPKGGVMLGLVWASTSSPWQIKSTIERDDYNEATRCMCLDASRRRGEENYALWGIGSRRCCREGVEEQVGNQEHHRNTEG